jgi:ergothioneine biosynthesis protein EgtB
MALSHRSLLDHFRRVRSTSEALCAPLGVEDHMLQAMPDVSPPKWHLAHTTWFFETFVLEEDANYSALHPAYRELFNSYYQGVGAQHPRPERGLLSRPTLDDVIAYRRRVDEEVLERLESGNASQQARRCIELGLHHEQQHQELLATDVLYNLSRNPLVPAYLEPGERAPSDPSRPHWVDFEGGLVQLGFEGEGFHFDNEGPAHRHWLEPFSLRSTLVSNLEFAAFVDQGGYADPCWWLSDGFAWVQEHNVQAPLYWRRAEGGWRTFSLHGLVAPDPHAPVTHVSAYEADAYARWAQARLPTEQEWEHAAPAEVPAEANLLSGGALRPLAPQASSDGLQAMYGDVWSWTSSAYAAYPGYQAPSGAIGEYNGKFMCNQLVLRGGSCVTPAGHVRRTYRNFFYPHQRWQFTGIRLARSL